MTRSSGQAGKYNPQIGTNTNIRHVPRDLRLSNVEIKGQIQLGSHAEQSGDIREKINVTKDALDMADVCSGTAGVWTEGNTGGIYWIIEVCL